LKRIILKTIKILSDSGNEDEGSLVDNLSGRQLRPRAEVVLPGAQLFGGNFQKKINILNNGNKQESGTDNEKSAASAPKINKFIRNKTT
jgi:hypothetical protein